MSWTGTPITQGTPQFVTTAELREYVRASADDDAELTRIILAAEADAQMYIGRLLYAAEATEVISVHEGATAISLRNWPVSEIGTIINPAGDEVDPDTFTQRLSTGLLTYKCYDSAGDTVPLTSGDWTVTYTGGLSGHTDWATIEQDLAWAIFDHAAELYQERDAGAKSETDGDLSRSLGGEHRWKDQLARYRSWA